MGDGWCSVYMTVKSSCYSNSRVIAFFNYFFPPPKWLPGGGQEAL